MNYNKYNLWLYQYEESTKVGSLIFLFIFNILT